MIKRALLLSALTTFSASILGYSQDPQENRQRPQGPDTLQDRPTGQPPFGPGPGGPFGRGPMAMLGGYQGLLMLLEQPEVAAEVSITDEQRPKLNELRAELQNKVRETMSSFDPAEMFELEEDARRAKFEEIRFKVESTYREQDAQLAKILDEKQLSRLKQLQIQSEGVAAFKRKEIAAAVKLTEEQTAKLQKVDQAMNVPPPGSGGGFPDFQKMEQDRSKAEQEFLASLTDDQKKSIEALRGKAFKFAMENRRGFGPMGPPQGGEKKLVKKYDTDDNGWLNRAERDAARQEAKENGGRGFGPPGGPSGRGGGPGGFGGGPGGPGGFGGGPGGPGGFGGGPGGPGGFGGGPGGPGGFGGGPGGPGGFGGGPGGRREPGKPGIKVAPADVKGYSDEDLYDTSIVRTIFLTFEKDDWEAEMADFKSTDVEVDATLLVDNKVYEKVGISFRGMSSFGMVPEGSKRSINISMDLADEDQLLLGYKNLNLLNSNGDPTMMHSVLYSAIARKYLPTPKVNEVRLVINGEDWGVYQNAQQFDKVFLSQNFNTTKGTRWKVPGSPAGGGSLNYLGDDVASYKRLYEIKSSDKEEAWQALINLCKAIDQTPTEELPEVLDEILDVDGVLKFLALDVALINEDGYWTRGSDYSIYLSESGKFSIIPHDMNESFMPAMGPGMGRGGMGRGQGGPGRSGPGQGGPRREAGGAEGGERRERRGESQEGDRPNASSGGSGTNAFALDPLIGLDSPNRPLRSKLLQVPQWRQRYLQYVGQIAKEDLAWENLGPKVEQIRSTIESLVEIDSRKMASTEAFKLTTSQELPTANGGDTSRHLRAFAEARRSYLLGHPEVKAALEAKD